MKPAAAALLWPTMLATAARVDLTAMEKVAVATYRKTGSDKALLHEKWERIEFEKTRSALIKLPDAVIDAVCGGKPCWRLSTQGFGPFSTTAFRFRSEGKDAPGRPVRDPGEADAHHGRRHLPVLRDGRAFRGYSGPAQPEVPLQHSPRH